MLERGATVAAVAAVSTFNLGAGLLLPAETLGQALQWQAVFLIIGTLLTCRTYDLVFFLRANHGLTLETAYRAALGIEALLALTIAVLAGIWAQNHALWPGGITPEWLFAGLATATTAFQGASQGYFRAQARPGYIIAALLVSTAGYGFGCLWLAWARPDAQSFLSVSLGLMAVRPLTLMAFAALIGQKPDAAAPAPDTTSRNTSMPWRAVALFLLKGQTLNAVKNNLLNVETLILGALAGSTTVAVYRVIRSLNNLLVVLLNIEYQKAFAALSLASKRGEELRSVMGAIRRRCLTLWLQGMPLVIASALVFAAVNPDPVYTFSPGLLVIAGLAILPVAWQQANFAYLSLKGDFVVMTIAYLAGMVALVAVAVVWPWQMSATAFFALSCISAVIVSATMHWLVVRSRS